MHGDGCSLSVRFAEQQRSAIENLVAHASSVLLEQQHFARGRQPRALQQERNTQQLRLTLHQLGAGSPLICFSQRVQRLLLGAAGRGFDPLLDLRQTLRP